MTRWLVDGMNVIGSRPTGWWRDREGAKRGLVDALGAFARARGEEVAVVFDGAPFPLDPPPGVEVSFASRQGRNAADDDIAARVERDPAPSELTVASSDAELALRARSAGAEVLGAGAFRRLIDEASG